MKKTLFVFGIIMIAVSLCFVSCNDDEKESKAAERSLVGRWQMLDNFQLNRLNHFAEFSVAGILVTECYAGTDSSKTESRTYRVEDNWKWVKGGDGKSRLQGYVLVNNGVEQKRELCTLAGNDTLQFDRSELVSTADHLPVVSFVRVK